MTKKQLSMNDTSFKTSLMEKIAYGMGDTACNVVFAITSSLIVYFYTNVNRHVCGTCRNDSVGISCI